MPLASTAQPAPSGDAENPGGFQHIPALDGIRGLAILLVLFFHLFAPNPETGSRLLNLFNQFRESCYLGVNLSSSSPAFSSRAFCSTHATAPTSSKPSTPGEPFASSRSTSGVLFFLLLLTRPLHLVWSRWPIYYLTYTANLALWQVGPLNLRAFNINHFWSLQVECSFISSGPSSSIASSAPKPSSLLSRHLRSDPDTTHRSRSPALPSRQRLSPLLPHLLLRRYL
jgi:hypothetical protein